MSAPKEPSDVLIAEAGLILTMIRVASIRFSGMPPPPKMLENADAWLARAEEHLRLKGYK